MENKMDELLFNKKISDGNHQEVLQKLCEIFDEQVFDLYERKSKTGDREYYTTYVMNDALESVIVYKNADISGEYINNYDSDIVADMNWDDDKNKYILRIRQADDNVCILWFEDFYIENRTYQYHNIGHYWVDGAEYLRQITYRIGLINDKYQVYQERFCNKEELELLPLMGFGPLQSYVYVSWDKKRKYPSSVQGIETFEKLLEEAHDYELLSEVRKCKERQSVYRQNKIANMLWQERHYEVIRLLEKKICHASKQYDMRSFGKEQDKLLELARSYIYDINGKRICDGKIEVLEEQPFVYWEDTFSVKFYFIRNYVKKVRRKNYIKQHRWEVLLEYTDDYKSSYDEFVRLADEVFKVMEI